MFLSQPVFPYCLILQNEAIFYRPYWATSVLIGKDVDLLSYIIRLVFRNNIEHEKTNKKQISELVHFFQNKN